MRFLLFLATATVLVAQYAPDSIGNKLVGVNITYGVHPFASFGTSLSVYTAAGAVFQLNATGDVAGGSNGTYIYTKTGANTATVRFSEVGYEDTVSTVTFTNPLGGSFTSGIAGKPIQQSGTFIISPFSTAAPLVNISTRTVLQPGQELNPGFVVGGTVPRRVLIRAVGPGLAQFGVSGVLETPVLTVFRGKTQLAKNAGWGGSKTLSDAFVATGAFGLPANSKDAAVLLTLAPDAYTAIVNGGAGDVLLEVYFVD